MTQFHEFLNKEGHAPEWPYPVRYEEEQEIETDVLVLGGGIAGCWAAIGAARKGVRVAIVEKAATIRSGSGGPGCDHWCDAPAHPLSKVDPDEWARRLAAASGGYANGIGRQIQCRENYDTLLEMELMGGKIRDLEGEYKDEQGYDAETGFLFSPRSNVYHDTNVVFRVWGTTFKPALRKECQRLGVKIYDRVMATSLLNQGGVQGARVVGATGLNNRTGEFMVFKAKATVLCCADAYSIWILNTELGGIPTFRSRVQTGEGVAMAWRAGAELTLMEKSTRLNLGTGHKHKWYMGASDASYENVPLVDANGKALPVVAQSWNKQTDMAQFKGRMPWEVVREAVLRGEYALPFFGDFPAMAEAERRVTWDMLLQEESVCKVITDTFNEAGFDPAKDQLMAYQVIEGMTPAQWREAGHAGNGPIIDWNLKTSLNGLYAAGEQLHIPGDHSFAASTGRYAGRKAADYVEQIGEPKSSREQVALEKARVYAPAGRSDGIDWKELHAGIAKVMQYFCSEFKTETLLKMGLDSLNDIEENWVPRLLALDPHKLMRGLEDTSLLTYAQVIMHASLARKASSEHLDFRRIDYPTLDPPEWTKHITVRQENGKVVLGERPLNYAGNLKESYEANNKDYTGVYKG